MVWCVVSAGIISLCRVLLLFIITCTINVYYDIYTHSFLSSPRFPYFLLYNSVEPLYTLATYLTSPRISLYFTVSNRILPYSTESAAHGIRSRAGAVYKSRRPHPCFPAAPPSVRYELTGAYATLHYTVLHYATLHNIVLHRSALHYTALHYTALQYCVILCNSVASVLSSHHIILRKSLSFLFEISS